MKPEERRTVVFSILGKTLLNIVAVAMIFALIILAWEKYDWLPFVKNIIRGVVIPILLGGLCRLYCAGHNTDGQRGAE